MRSLDWKNTSAPIVLEKDSVRSAEQCLAKHALQSVAVVGRGKFLGFYVKEDADSGNHSPESARRPLKECMKGSTSCVFEKASHYEVIDTMLRHDRLPVAIIDTSRKYLGTIFPSDVLKHMAKLSAFRSPGDVLGLEMFSHDYTLEEVARLVERNDAKIIDLSIFSHATDPRKIYIFFKINHRDGTRVQATFERFGYHIHWHASKYLDRDSHAFKNYNELMKYLNI